MGPYTSFDNDFLTNPVAGQENEIIIHRLPWQTDHGHFIKYFQEVVKKMDSCSRPDINVAGSSAPGIQESIATMPVPPGKTQPGKVVQCETTAIQTPRQLAITPGICQRIITGYTVTVTNASWPAGKSGMFEMQERGCDRVELYRGIGQLYQATSFREEDVDRLLAFRRKLSLVFDWSAWAVMEKVLVNLFWFVLFDASDIPVEKIAALSQWIDVLGSTECVDKQLATYNNQWRELNKCAVNKMDRVSSDVPSISVPVFVDQTALKSVAMKEKPGTAWVSSDQSRANAALSQPVSEEPSIPEARSSFTSAEQASVVTISETCVISSESQAEVEGDKSFVIDFSETVEQLVSTGMAIITPASQQTAPSPFLQCADQFPCAAERYEPQSIVTEPIETSASARIASHEVDMKAADSDVWSDWCKGSNQKTAKGMAALAKTQADRGVHEVAATRTYNQMLDASLSLLRPGLDNYRYAEVVRNALLLPWKMADTEESCMFRIMECEYQAEDEFRTDVESSLKTLDREWKAPGADAWSFCLTVAMEVCRLKKKYKLKGLDDDRYKFIRLQLGPHYMKSLHPALETVMCKAKDDCGWEYYETIDRVAQCLELQPNVFVDEYQNNQNNQNRELLKDIYSQLLDSELRYMEFMRDFPFSHTAVRSSRIIKQLLSGNKYSASGFRLIPEDRVTRIEKERNRLIKIIESNNAKEEIDRKTERLKRDVYSGDADSLIRRRYSDLLREEFLELECKLKKNNSSTGAQLPILEKLFELRVIHATVLSGFHSLPREIEVIIRSTTKTKLKKSLMCGVRLEKGMLDFIDYMLDQDVMREEHGILCLRCKELEFLPANEMEVIARTGRITVDECEAQTVEIKSRLATARNFDELIKIAEMLKQLLCNMVVLNIIDTCKVTIKTIKDDLSVKLFQPVIKLFHKYKFEKGMDETELSAAMSKHRPALARLIPYAFVLDESDKDDLIKIVDAAWCCDLEKLSRAESFQEESVDCLLDLKHIAPHIPNPHIRITVEQALIKLFRFVDQNGPGDIPVTKIAILSQWVDGLNRVRKVDDQLKTCNAKWKETNEGAISRKDMVSSDMPLTSVQLFEQVYSAFSQHSEEGYLTAARLPGSVDIEKSPQKEDFEIIRDLIDKKLFA